MKAKMTVLTLSLALLGAQPSMAEDDYPSLKFRGFGSLTGVHSNSETSDFTNTPFQPKGAGMTDSWSGLPDSRIAVQADIAISQSFSAVLQVVAEQDYKNSFTPHVEWANLIYRYSPNFSIKIGRINAPVFMFSESRKVAYSNTMVRWPVDVYFQLPLTSSDGADVTFSFSTGPVRHTVQGFYGNSKTPASSTIMVDAKDFYGLNNQMEFGDTQLRVAYSRFNLQTSGSQFENLYNAFRNFGPAGNAYADKWLNSENEFKVLALGFNHDPGNYYISGEYIQRRVDRSLADVNAWYLAAGYRFGKFTPYLSYAQSDVVNRKVERGVVGAPPPLNAVAAGLTANQQRTEGRTITVGTRWDCYENLACKLQFDRIEPTDTGRSQLIAGPQYQLGTSVNLFSVALDFVF